MRILFFSDLHGDMKALAKLKEMSKESDLVVNAGDMTRMEDNLPAILRKFNSFGKSMLIIHGNHENEERLKEAVKLHKNLIFLHKSAHHLGDYVFLGYGGDGFSSKDSEFVTVARKFFKPQIEGKNRIILITHGPPFGTVLDDLNGDHKGNKSYRDFIDAVRPHLVIAGHLHENMGKHQKIDRTLLINPGKQGAIVNI